MIKSKVPDAGKVAARRGQHVNLLAGELYFGGEAHSVRTLLGSCVAVALWNPKRRLGGMCHFLLPHRVRGVHEGRDGRFGEEAIEMLVEALLKAGTRPAEYEAHLYGGADTFPDRVGGVAGLNVGERNIAHAWEQIDRHGFVLQGVDVGDHVPRSVNLDLVKGEVAMRRGQTMKKAKAS